MVTRLSPPFIIVLTAFGFFLFLWLIIGPVIAKQKNLAEQTAQAKVHLQEVQEITARYQALKQSAALMPVVPEGSLFSITQQIVSTLTLNSYVDYVRPETITKDGVSVEAVSLRLKGLPLDDLLDFLLACEVKNKKIKITNLGLKKDDNNYIDATLVLVSKG